MKQILITLFIVEVLCQTGFALPIVQCTAGKFEPSLSTSSTDSFSSAVTVGNRVYIFGSTFGLGTGTAGINGASDNQSGNSYSIDKLILDTSSGNTVAAFLITSKVVGSSGTFTVTIDYNMAAAASDWMACEVSGINPTTPLDQTGSSVATSGTSNTTTAGGANSQANEFVIACQVQGNANPTGYTNLYLSSGISTSCDYKTVTASETSAVTYSSSGFSVGAAVLATYKYTPGGGGGSTVQRKTMNSPRTGTRTIQ